MTTKQDFALKTISKTTQTKEKKITKETENVEFSDLSFILAVGFAIVITLIALNMFVYFILRVDSCG